MAALLELVAGGQRAALAELYDCLSPGVLSEIRLQLADPVGVGHALRAVFVGIWLMARYRPPPAQQHTWVTRMTERRSGELRPASTGSATDRNGLAEQISSEFHHLLGTRNPAPTAGRPLLVTSFDKARLGDVRRRVATLTRATDLEAAEAGEFVLAVNEIAINAIRHGGGAGELYLWQDGTLVCEVRDHGSGFDPGRYLDRTDRPVPTPDGGMGLWITKFTCAEMSISSTAAGTTSRIRAGASPFATMTRQG